MKGFLRMMAVALLILIALLTFSRRENSAVWITFRSTDYVTESTSIMTGDGQWSREFFPHTNYCATDTHLSPDGLSYAAVCDNTLTTAYLQPGSSTKKRVYSNFDAVYEGYWSQDGQRLLVSHDDLELTIIDADGSTHHLPGFGYQYPQWSPDGEWVYVMRRLVNNPQSSLHRINTRTLALEHVLTTSNTPGYHLSWSPDDAQVALRIFSDEERYRFFLASPDGSNLTPIVIDRRMAILAFPRWSPDGEWIAFVGGLQADTPGIYRMRPDGTDLVSLTDNLRNITGFQWSQDGQWLLFDSDHEAISKVYRLRADGSQMEDLTPGPRWGYAPQFGYFSGADWNPLWLILAVAGLMILSVVGRFRL